MALDIIIKRKVKERRNQMSNPSNVIPYGKMAHEAALCGGPDCYVSKIAASNYNLGFSQGKMLSLGKSAAIALGAMLLLESGKAVYRYYKNEKLKRIEYEEELSRAYGEFKQRL